MHTAVKFRDGAPIRLSDVTTVVIGHPHPSATE
jgi:hypothetical protein